VKPIAQTDSCHAAQCALFEETTDIPVVALDDAWLQAIQAAQSNWG
jgi:hypothetical protein